MNLGHLTLQSRRGWGREFGNVCEEDCGRSCDGRRTGVQRRWPGCWHRDRGTTYARRPGDSVAARSRSWGRWGLLGPWQRSRLGRPWRLRLRRKLGLRARVGLRHGSVWACHLVSLVTDRRGSGSVVPATRRRRRFGRVPLSHNVRREGGGSLEAYTRYVSLMRQNRAGDPAATPRAAWLARQGDPAARPEDATASASWTAGAADRTAPRAVPAGGCRADREVPAAAVACRFKADRTDPASTTR